VGDIEYIIYPQEIHAIEDGNLKTENVCQPRETLSMAHKHQYLKQFSKELNNGRRMHSKKNKKKTAEVDDENAEPSQPIMFTVNRLKSVTSGKWFNKPNFFKIGIKLKRF